MEHTWIYNVFLSFRGEDTRNTFASHLLSAFRREGIHFFKDDDQNDVGRSIGPKLIHAINHSNIGLVLFSKKYADSRWCLDELVEMLECNKRYRDQHNNNKHTVIPIFYDVEPRDVRRQSGVFGEGFAECKAKHMEDVELVEKWRQALEEATSYSGWELQKQANGDESMLIQMIMKQVQREILQRRPLYNLKDVVGLEAVVDEILPLCNLGSDDVRFIGMYGVQGIGKTAIAKSLHGRVLDEFDDFSFIEFIGDETENMVLHQKKLLDDILKPREDLNLYGVHTNKTEISKRLARKKVFVILDNVVNKSQVDALAGDRDWFGARSRILIITRDGQLLKDLDVDEKYMVTGLGTETSLQLFCKHAFQRDGPEEGYEDLCRSFLHYTGGHPLAIKGLGSLLSKKSEKQWHEILDKLEREPHLDTIGVYYGPMSSLFPYKSNGQHGGLGGMDFDDGIYTGVRQITVCIGSPDSWPLPFIIVYYDLNGCVISSFMHGLPPREARLYQVKLNYPDEYLISVSGFIGETFGASFVNELKFTSNKRTYGPFGVEKGTFFTSSMETNGKIVGLMGRCGSNLDSIGAYVAPNSHMYPFQVVGPLGGETGEFWNDERHTDIRQITIVSNEVIETIAIVYDNLGRASDIITHGKSGQGGTIDMVELDHPYEYLTSISGYTIVDAEARVSIQSITFQSNVRRYGPYGEEKGRHFSFPATGGKIVGFFGRNHAHLESIGAYFEPVSHNYHFKTLGPFGGEVGHVWDDGQHDDVTEITIACGLVINSICFHYADDGRLSLPLSRHGGSGGTTHTVKLDYPDEYLTSMSGYFGGPRGDIIHYLAFQSTQRVYGPFGTKATGSRYFSLPSNFGKIVGFYGRCGAYLDSIGAYVKPYSKQLYPFKSVGLFGGPDGDPWDDGNGANIRQIDIVLHHDNSAIKSIGFVYEREGSLVQSPMIDGVDHNGKKHEVNLDDGEYLTSFSGYITGDDSDHAYIGSLTFQSNRCMYGPFGAEKGKYFSCPATGGKICGFYGRRSKDYCLNAIGAHFEPISLLYPQRKVGPFGGQGGRFWFWHQKDPSEVKKLDVQGVMMVNISWGDVINNISVHHEVDGNPVMTGVRGGGMDRTNNNEWIHLKYPSEYFTSISGYIRDDSSGPVVIRSLTFHSNLERYGPYGKEEGKFFWYPSSGTQIIGLFGRAGRHLDAIGVYTEPIPHLYPLRSMGPFGGGGGTTWSDGIFTDVRGVVICVGSVVSSICFEYDNNGTPIQCSEHGSKNPNDQEYQVKLDFPKEYLKSVSGYVKEYSGSTVVGSLTFESNKIKYGPYGIEEGDKFLISGRIIGFNGSFGSVLNSIGAHLLSTIVHESMYA